MGAIPLGRRTSPFQLALIMLTLLLALAAIIVGVQDRLADPTSESWVMYITMGILVLALSTYMLYQTRKRMLRLGGIEMQPITTTLQCQKCTVRNIRDFKSGDFVFKETEEQCPSCKENMIVSSIYREVKEKGKPKDSKI